MLPAGIDCVFALVHTAQTPQLPSGAASGVRSRGMGHLELSWSRSLRTHDAIPAARQLNPQP
jgi:hypothetical protein